MSEVQLSPSPSPTTSTATTSLFASSRPASTLSTRANSGRPFHPTRTSNGKRKASPSKENPAKSAKGHLPTKPKQSKSRNGCTTCKAKRLKCDEIKPICQQCTKRGVQCGGYKKEWKWKTFEEPVVFGTGGTTSTKQKRNSVSVQQASLPRNVASPPASDASTSTAAPATFFEAPLSQRPLSPESSSSSSSSSPPEHDASTMYGTRRGGRGDSGTDRIPFVIDTNLSNIPAPHDGDSQLTAGLEDLGFPTSFGTAESDALASPALGNFLLPDAGIGGTIAFEGRNDSSLVGLDLEGADMDVSVNEDEIEELIRPMEQSLDLVYTTRNLAGLTPRQSRSFDIPSAFLQRPMFAQSSTEMLLRQFDSRTCGILSVKDGIHENPWRTIVLPLVHQSPPLYHAVASMSAFHNSKGGDRLKVMALEHRMQSITLLQHGIGEMQPDVAIAITLVLAFGESWDDLDVSTGYKHLKGAKPFVDKALRSLMRHETDRERRRRIKFLCNTWVYMDVIARLTSIESDDSTDFDSALWAASSEADDLCEVDPLMGCAATMFPLIGRVANLVRHVRAVRESHLSIIQQAIELKKLLEEWSPPTLFNEPEDERCAVDAAMYTAEAYRWATLLYLHQAVPEIPSRTSAQLAKKVLVNLMLVPMTSRTIIVQIYPLLAASCEVSRAEDRAWIGQRWASMSRTMRIGNIDRCTEVVKEVWQRRDESEAAIAQRPHGARSRHSSQSTFSPVRASGWRSRSSGLDEATYGALQDQELEDMDLMMMMMEGSNVYSAGSTSAINVPPGSSSHWRGRRPCQASFRSATQASSRDASVEAFEELPLEKTVRGSHHWLGVMQDWRWEVLLG